MYFEKIVNIVNGLIGFHANAPCDGTGTETRTRTIERVVKFFGKKCEGPLVEERTCNGMPCVQDCKVSEWNSWGSLQSFVPFVKNINTSAECIGLQEFKTSIGVA